MTLRINLASQRSLYAAVRAMPMAAAPHRASGLGAPPSAKAATWPLTALARPPQALGRGGRRRPVAAAGADETAGAGRRLPADPAAGSQAHAAEDHRAAKAHLLQVVQNCSGFRGSAEAAWAALPDALTALQAHNPSAHPNQDSLRMNKVWEMALTDRARKAFRRIDGLVAPGMLPSHEVEPLAVYQIVNLQTGRYDNAQLFALVDGSRDNARTCGIALTQGQCQALDAKRLEVRFHQVTLRPLDVYSHNTHWRQFLGACAKTPEQARSGVLHASPKPGLPKSAWNDTHYLDDDLRLCAGSFGSTYILRARDDLSPEGGMLRREA